MMVLAACGGDAPADPTAAPDTAVEPTATEEVTDDTQETDATDADADGGDAGFTATVSGSVEETIASNGFFQCDNSGAVVDLPPAFDIFSDISASASLIQIRVPADIEDGTTLPLIGSNETSDIVPEGRGLIDYSSPDTTDESWGMGSGEITFDAVPSAAGEQITGSFTAELTLTFGDAPQPVTVTGTFDITAEDFAFADCPES